jgi:predicted DCC family thiol-disulfide oxidoreductase YuxK
MTAPSNWPARRGSLRDRMASVPTCTAYFDGVCPVCRAEIAHYQRQRGAEAITWIDAASCEESDLGAGLVRSAALARFHVREADGSLVVGGGAFVAIWRRLPAFAWLSRFASSRLATALLDLAYLIFLRIRPAWRRFAVDRRQLPAESLAKPGRRIGMPS